MHIPPPLIAIALGVGMKFAADATPQLTALVGGRAIIAGSLFVAGIVIALAGIARFRRHRTTVNPLQPERATTLVTDGVYRVTRNPMYLGLLVMLLAWGVWLANPVAFAMAFVFVPLLNRLQIIPEEQALRSRFGEQFETFARRTRRWL